MSTTCGFTLVSGGGSIWQVRAVLPAGGYKHSAAGADSLTGWLLSRGVCLSLAQRLAGARRRQLLLRAIWTRNWPPVGGFPRCGV